MATATEATHYQMQMPVSAEFHGGDEWTSTGIDFSDYGRMTTVRQGLAVGRKLECPAWAINDKQLAEVLVAFFERRARKATTGTLGERLAAATKALEAARPRTINAIDRLCAEYVYCKRQRPFDGQQEKLRRLETQIESFDSQLCSTVVQVVGIVHRYYRLGYSSTDTAAECHCKPPMVRMILMRMRQTAEAVQNGTALRPKPVKCLKEPVALERTPRTPQIYTGMARAEAMAALRKQGHTYREIGQRFGVTNARVIHILHKAGLFVGKTEARALVPAKGFQEPNLPGADMFVAETGHGQAARKDFKETPEYSAWRNICCRQNPKHPKHSAGIRLHPRWAQSFVAFLFDVGVRPHPNAQLTRKDKAGHWEPTNVEWR